MRQNRLYQKYLENKLEITYTQSLAHDIIIGNTSKTSKLA